MPAPRPREIDLELLTRDPSDSAASIRTERVLSSRIGVVIVDMWDYHWCSTWLGRAGTLIPRMNRALQAARSLGMTIVHAPTDCASAYAGTPQREQAAATPPVALPPLQDLGPTVEWGLGLGIDCMCGGPYPCVVNYDNAGIDPRLEIAPGDLITSGPGELYSLFVQRGLTHLIFGGGATNMCLLSKPEGMAMMRRRGVRSLLARDLTEAFGPCRDSEEADAHTTYSVEFIERHIGPSVDFVALLRASGAWDDAWTVDSVLIRPWGRPDRPTFFDTDVTVSLSIPRPRGAGIRYSTDGSEPTAASASYQGPFPIRETTTVRAAAFRDERRVSLESTASYVRLPPVPSVPDVHLSDLKPAKVDMAMWNEWYPVPSNPGPQMRRSYDGSPLVLRGVTYRKGIGLRSPSQLVYEAALEWGALVARAGIAEGLLEADNGRGRAQYPMVVFRVFVDGQCAAESPVMRISQEPWRFHVALPTGARMVSLAAAVPAGHRPGELVCWVDAGFLRGRRA
jgi:nicotinamidase-related amidase